MQMTDIHAHIIPGVDDGSESLEMSMRMLLRAYDQGVRGFFATPHSSAFDSDPSQVQKSFQSLQSMASRYFPDASVYLGCEVYCDCFGMEETLAALGDGKYPAMNRSAYVLAEFSHWTPLENAVTCVEKLVNAGWKPIIAHMERYHYLRNNQDLITQFRELGCRIQINTYSLQEEMDEEIKGWAKRLVTDRKVDFLGTDMHRTYHRPPSVQGGLTWLYENCDKDYADAIVFGNAQALLQPL